MAKLVAARDDCECGRLARLAVDRAAKEDLRASREADTMLRMPELSEESRLGSKVVVRRMRRCRNNLSRGERWRNRKRSRRTSYGRVLYNYYRTYDPATGRYLESDPIGLAAGLNTYSYVGNMPTMQVDPFGLEVTGTYDDELSNKMPGNAGELTRASIATLFRPFYEMAVRLSVADESTFARIQSTTSSAVQPTALRPSCIGFGNSSRLIIS